MNPSPRLHGADITPPTDGILAMRNVEDAFWQSRMTLAGRRAELPNLVSLHDLARKIRATTYLAIIAPDIGKLPLTIHTGADIIGFTGIPARALTPTGSFDTAMDRSDVATAPGAGRRVYQDGGHRFFESACRYAEAQAAGVISESEARALTRADAGFPTNPV